MLDVLKTLVAAVSCCRKGLFEVQESCQDYPSAVPRKLGCRSLFVQGVQGCLPPSLLR